MFLLNKSPMSTNEKFITAIRYFCESLCNRREHSGKHNLHASLLVWIFWMESFVEIKLCVSFFSFSLSLSLSLSNRIKLRRFCASLLLTENAIVYRNIVPCLYFYFGLPSPPSSITCGHIVKTNWTTIVINTFIQLYWVQWNLRYSVMVLNQPTCVYSPFRTKVYDITVANTQYKCHQVYLKFLSYSNYIFFIFDNLQISRFIFHLNQK